MVTISYWTNKNIAIADFEVFYDDWILVVKFLDSEDYLVFHNDPSGVESLMDVRDPILGGFNIKGYDQHILRGVLDGWSPRELKALNDFIIGGNKAWDYKPLKAAKYLNVRIFDLMDDTQVGTSLKSIEAHTFQDIHETEVDFNLQRKLTQEELELTIKYCVADVENTEKLFYLRENYLRTKIDLGEEIGLDMAKAMKFTNAGLTAEYLRATPVDYDDERDYVLPDNLLTEWIPEGVMNHFMKIRDPSVSYEEVFKSSYEFKVGDCECKVGWGGIHGAIPHYVWKEGCDD